MPTISSSTREVLSQTNSQQEVRSLTIFISSATRKDVGLFVSIARPGSIEDRSVEVSKAMLSRP